MYDPARPTSGLRPTAGAQKRTNFEQNAQHAPARFDAATFSKQMPELILSSAQRQALKGRAHSLRPVVLLGASGLTDKVLREIDRALAAHSLIKVKVPNDDRNERTQIAAEVAGKLSAANVQSIGKIIVLFRPQPESEEKQEPDTPRNQRADERRSRS
jgi:putative YhbY family RNA-binding protein